MIKAGVGKRAGGADALEFVCGFGWKLGRGSPGTNLAGLCGGTLQAKKLLTAKRAKKNREDR